MSVGPREGEPCAMCGRPSTARIAACPTCGFVICEACYEDYGPGKRCEECNAGCFVLFDDPRTLYGHERQE